MQLEFAFLADAAAVTGDGRFSVLGGDRIAVEAASFPALVPTIALVLKLRFSPHEYGQSFPIRIRVHDDEDNSITPDAVGVVEAPKPKAPDLPSVAGVVASFIGVTLQKPGKCAFEPTVGDNTFPPVYLYGIQPESGEPA